MPLPVHRIRNPLLPCNFQWRIELPNLDCWHLTILPASSLTWHKYTFAVDTSSPVFPEESPCLEIKVKVSTPTAWGARTTERKTGAKWPFSNEAARKSCGAPRVMWQPGPCRDPGDRAQWGRGWWEQRGTPQKMCLALMTAGWPWTLPFAESIHASKCKPGPHFPAPLSFPFVTLALLSCAHSFFQKPSQLLFGFLPLAHSS